MAKLEKDALLSKIVEKLSDNEDVAIELMEDITDSFSEDKSSAELEKVKAELEAKNKEYDELKEKYKERFLEPSVKNIPKEEPVKELKESVVYDLREI